MKHLIKFLCGTSLCLLFGCMQQDQQMMQQMEANKVIAKGWWDAFNQKDAAKVASTYAENAVVTDFGSPKPDSGIAQIQQLWQMYATAFPDAHITFDGETAHGDMVVLQWHATGTNTGPMMNMPATNKPIDVHGCSVYQIANGKVVREWSYWDQAGFMKQLGMMPEPGAQSAGMKKEMKKK